MFQIENFKYTLVESTNNMVKLEVYMYVNLAGNFIIQLKLNE